jgi:hypothetical protein
VLGVPRWWPPNEDPQFYDDSAVFRPQREKPIAPPRAGPFKSQRPLKAPARP